VRSGDIVTGGGGKVAPTASQAREVPWHCWRFSPITQRIETEAGRAFFSFAQQE
jgi:hypothetical protein